MTSFRAPSAQLQRPLLHVLAALMTCNLASRFARHISTQRDTNVGVTPRNGNTTSLNVVRRVRGASKNVISPRPARRRYAVHKYTRATLPTFFFNYVTNEHVNRKSRDISAQWSGKVPLCAGRFRCPRKCPRKWPTGLQQIATSELPPSARSNRDPVDDDDDGDWVGEPRPQSDSDSVTTTVTVTVTR